MTTRNCRASMLLSLIALFLTSSELAAQQPRRAIDPSLVLEQFDVFNDGDELVVPVTFGDKRYLFVVDTGAEITIYDKSLRSCLGEPKSVDTVQAASGETTVEFFDAPDAFLGKLNLKTDETVGCHDLGQLRQVSGLETHGIIGMNFLRHHVVHLDSDSGKLSFLKSAPSSPGTPLLIIYDENAPMVEVELPGIELQRFLVDTGSSGNGSGSLETTVFSGLVSRGALRTVASSLHRDIRGTSRTQNAVIAEIHLRHLKHANLIFSDHWGSAPNYLGLGFWERYNVTFDFPNHLIYLQPSKQINKADLQDLSGIHLLRVDGRIVIDVVDPESQASRAGIQGKDLLLKIDGDDATAIRPHVIRQRLCADGKTVRLTIRRGDRVFDVPLELRERRAVELSAGNAPPGPAAGTESRPR
jgi:predicted aspartyl protease